MKIVEAAFDTEVIKDTGMSDSVAKARRRQARCVMSGKEQELYAYAPNEAHDINNPAYPAEVGGVDYSD